MKNILLIGGSYGIGRAIANQLELNTNIFIASRTSESLSRLNSTHIPFDASTDTLDISKLPAVIDGLVYCPGSINLRPFKGLKIETFEIRFYLARAINLSESEKSNKIVHNKANGRWDN